VQVVFVGIKNAPVAIMGKLSVSTVL